MKKKIVLLLCVATMACMSFTACGSDNNEPTTEEAGEENTMGDPEKEVEDVNEEDLTGENEATENEATEGEEAEAEETNAESTNVEESESGEAVENVAPEDAAAEEAGEATEENVETAE